MRVQKDQMKRTAFGREMKSRARNDHNRRTEAP
jgi:hypothetical protein